MDGIRYQLRERTPDYWREQATQARERAAHIKAPLYRQELLEVAKVYDLLADDPALAGAIRLWLP